ncbi:MAG: DUF3422 domain-containing protein [Pseudomonadota bacterium]
MQSQFEDHHQRIALTNELHARPFQSVTAPGRFLHLAFKLSKNAAERDHAADRDHLIALLDYFGANHPQPGAGQFSTDLGRFRLKWESHTEFVSYTLIEEGQVDTLFAGELLKHLSQDWLQSAPGKVVAAIQCELIELDTPSEAELKFPETILRQFDQQSVAAGYILDGAAIAVGDFRIHEQGLTRFAVAKLDQTGPRRLGRAVQRLLEIEVYRSMAMLALPIARDVSKRLNQVERELAELVSIASDDTRAQSDAVSLNQLISLSAEIESMAAASAFRFNAARAYERIVDERIRSLQEQPVGGRQQFGEFMARRFDPAMRTIGAARERLDALSHRAARTSELLRTRVNISVEEQNKSLLESMNQRAALQLRLQETVEGLSVVAISYYAVSLCGYLLTPLSDGLGLDRNALLALVTAPVVLVVWWFTRQIRRRASE